MSMNKTCPISNFTSDERSDGIKDLFLSGNQAFNESIPSPRHSFLSARDFVNIAPLQLGEEILLIHFEAVVDLNNRAGTIFSASVSNRGSPCSGASGGSTRITPRASPSWSR